MGSRSGSRSEGSAGGAARGLQLELDVDRLALGQARGLLQTLGPGRQADHGPIARDDPEAEAPVIGRPLLDDELLLAAGQAHVGALARLTIAVDHTSYGRLPDVVVGGVDTVARHSRPSPEARRLPLPCSRARWAHPPGCRTRSRSRRSS